MQKDTIISLSIYSFSDTVKLLRIPFSFFLMPVFFFALSQANNINWINVAVCFITLHLFIYPASNGYNSYMDRDTTSIGGLENPPQPTRKLFYASLFLDFVGLCFAAMVNIHFFKGVLAYIIASRAYSYKRIRLKKYPIPGFLTVVLFQGAVTYWMIYNGVNASPMKFNYNSVAVLLACSFLIGGIYPLTQVYQHKADKESGDITISYKLGIKGTFVFSAVMFGIADSLFYFYFSSIHSLGYFFLLQLFLLPVIECFTIWFLYVLADERHASFSKTMRMNLTASACMNICFILMFILNVVR
jgi:1,4-dihydroxy-2-naphthoate octaprenyltransferase